MKSLITTTFGTMEVLIKSFLNLLKLVLMEENQPQTERQMAAPITDES
jgi:hypothetical protein